MDKIIIKDLEVFTKIGVGEPERANPQKLLISVDMFLDIRMASFTDEFSGTLDYAKVCHFIQKSLSNKNYKLIEAVAEYLARDLLLKFKPLLQAVTITVKKPWAPIGMPLETAGVCITRKWNTVYLSLGSNMGDREAYLKEAVKFFSKHKLCRLVRSSDIIETEPYGEVEQDKFLNMAIELKTLLTPVELLSLANEVEARAHRTREVHWGPRTLDVDILFYNSEILSLKAPNLNIPHIDLHNRRFVLEPLNQIAPGFVHPIYNKTIRVMYEDLNE